ncbi:hypothetical protein [Pseudomonas sp. St316]|uniref:hypothetical protein n=1 Tax=Pseudomonas sp. St316 TaxID=2678257 RepID=UPI0020180678|nr:hypothetical protein [Pseudomonas sp. St316]
MPEILAKNKKSHPTTLYPIKDKHVSRLRKRALLFWDDTEKAGREDSSNFFNLEREAESATEAYNHAKENKGQPGITKEGAATIKRVAADYDSIMARRAANKKARDKAQQAREMEEIRKKGKRERNVRTRYLGYQPDDV